MGVRAHRHRPGKAWSLWQLLPPPQQPPGGSVGRAPSCSLDSRAHLHPPPGLQTARALDQNWAWQAGGRTADKAGRAKGWRQTR